MATTTQQQQHNDMLIEHIRQVAREMAESVKQTQRNSLKNMISSVLSDSPNKHQDELTKQTEWRNTPNPNNETKTMKNSYFESPERSPDRKSNYSSVSPEPKKERNSESGFQENSFVSPSKNYDKIADFSPSRRESPSPIKDNSRTKARIETNNKPNIAKINDNMRYEHQDDYGFDEQSFDNQGISHFKPKNFYERELQAYNDRNQKLELLRIKKEREEEAKFNYNPKLSSKTRQIINEKLHDIKPIHERVADIINKKNVNIVAKKREIIQHTESEIEAVTEVKPTKKFNEGRFNNWMNNHMKWHYEKQEKSKRIKEENEFLEEKILLTSKPTINKKSSELAKNKNKNNIEQNRHNILYKEHEERQVKTKKLIQEHTPIFTPVINKQLPKYLLKAKQKKIQSDNALQEVKKGISVGTSFVSSANPSLKQSKKSLNHSMGDIGEVIHEESVFMGDNDSMTGSPTRKKKKYSVIPFMDDDEPDFNDEYFKKDARRQSKSNFHQPNNVRSRSVVQENISDYKMLEEDITVQSNMLIEEYKLALAEMNNKGAIDEDSHLRRDFSFNNIEKAKPAGRNHSVSYNPGHGNFIASIGITLNSGNGSGKENETKENSKKLLTNSLYKINLRNGVELEQQMENNLILSPNGKFINTTNMPHDDIHVDSVFNVLKEKSKRNKTPVIERGPKKWK